MSNDATDAALVAGHLSGDPNALAAIYDRYADSLYDTSAAMLRDRDDAADVVQDVIVIAAQKLDQLRDPTRLKPWLFAIMRNEVYRRTKQRKRTVATDFGNEFDVVDERGLDADAETASGNELAELVRGAAGGLDERDQLVLELSVRQGLEGQDLADALGVSANQSYTLVHRMRDRIERSLGAFCVASTGRDDCDELAALLQKWDGEFTVLIRKRVARHIDQCDICSDSRRKVAPLALFGAAPVLAAPSDLRDRVLAAARQVAPGIGTTAAAYGFGASGGFPGPVHAARRVAAWVVPAAAAAVVLVLAAVAFILVDRGDDSLRTAVQAPGMATTAEAVADSAPPESTLVPPTTVFTTTPRVASVETGADAAISTDNSSTSTTSTSTTSTTTTIAATTTTPPPPTTAALASPAVVTTAPSPITTAPPVITTAPPVITTAPPIVTTAPPVTTTTTTAPPAPGALVGSSATVDLGGDTRRVAFTLSNPGGLPVNWTLGGPAAPFTIDPSNGAVGPGSSVDVTIEFDRSGLPEGDVRTSSITFDGDGGQQVPLKITGGVERPPVFLNPQMSVGFCNTLLDFTVTANITDDSLPLRVVVDVVGPAGQTGNGTMQPSDRAGGHTGSVSVVNTSGDPIGLWSFSIAATDTRGNARTASGSLDVNC